MRLTHFPSLLTLASAVILRAAAAPSPLDTFAQLPPALQGRGLSSNDAFILASCTVDVRTQYGFNYKLYELEIHYYQDRAAVGTGNSDHSTVVEIAGETTRWWEAPYPVRGIRWTGLFNQGGPTSNGFFTTAVEDFYGRAKDNLVGLGWYIDGGADDWTELSKYSFYFCYRDDDREFINEAAGGGRHICNKQAYCVKANN